MLHPLRFIPAVFGLGLIALMLTGPADPAANLCRLARHSVRLQDGCLATPHLAAYSGALAIALVAWTLLSIRRWQWDRHRVISYESDAGRWVMIGWVLAVGGAISLLLGLMLIGSGGWPFSQQSRHIQTRSGQLPVRISTVQRRYFAQFAGTAEGRSVCASFGEVTIANRSRHRALAIDLGLAVTPRHGGEAPQAALPSRSDLAAIARRGHRPQALFDNPVALAPRQSLRRELVFVIRLKQGDAALRDRDYAFALEVRDRLSGEAVAMTLPAEYRG